MSAGVAAARPLASLRSPLNPSDDAWDAAEYMRVLHGDATREQLIAGRKGVAETLAVIDKQAERLVRDTYPTAFNEMERARRAVRQLQGGVSGGCGSAGDFAAAKNTLAVTRYCEVLHAQESVERL